MQVCCAGNVWYTAQRRVEDKEVRQGGLCSIELQAESLVSPSARRFLPCWEPGYSESEPLIHGIVITDSGVRCQETIKATLSGRTPKH